MRRLAPLPMPCASFALRDCRRAALAGAEMLVSGRPPDITSTGEPPPRAPALDDCTFSRPHRDSYISGHAAGALHAELHLRRAPALADALLYR